MPKHPHCPCMRDGLFPPLVTLPSLCHPTSPLTLGHCHSSGIPTHGPSWVQLTLGASLGQDCTPVSWEPGLNRSRTLGAHPMGGTVEAVGGLRGADEAGLSPSSPCPKGPLAPKILASHDANHCSFGRARRSRQSPGWGAFPLSSWSSRAGEGLRENMGILCQVTAVCLSFPTLLALFFPGSLRGELLPGWLGKVSAQGCGCRKEMLGGTGDWEERLNYPGLRGTVSASTAGKAAEILELALTWL